MLEGRIKPPSGPQQNRNPADRMAVDVAMHADPDFDVSKFDARNKTWKAVSPDGRIGQQVNAGRTVIHHLGLLNEMAEAQENGDYQKVNELVNRYRTETGDERVTNFNTAAFKIAEENTRYYRGSVGAEADIVREMETLNPNASPAQIRGTIGTVAELIQKRMKVTQDQVNESMGRYNPYSNLLGEDKPTLDKLAGIAKTQREERKAAREAKKGTPAPTPAPPTGTPTPGGAAQAAPGGAPAAPAAPTTFPKVQNDADFDKLPSGTVYVGPDNKVRRKP
jgi:hypothetical protein